MVTLGSMRPQEVLPLKDQRLWRIYAWGVIVFGAPNPPGWFC